MIMLTIMTKSTKSAKTLQAESPQKVDNFRGELPARQTEVATKSALPQTRAGIVYVEKSIFILLADTQKDFEYCWIFFHKYSYPKKPPKALKEEY